MASNGITITTGVVKEERVFEWKIDDFQRVITSPDLITSQQHRFEMGSQIDLPTTWNCFLSSRHWLPEPESDWMGISFFLEQKPESVTSVNANFAVTIKGGQGQIVKKLQAPIADMVVHPVVEFDYLLDIKQPLVDLPLVNGALILEISFTLWKPTLPVNVDRDLSEILAEYSQRFMMKLVQDLDESDALVGQGADLRMTIISRDKWKFPANRGILSARSPVFKAMFRNRLMEVETGRVDIKDLSGKTLTVLMTYLNSGTLHEDWRNPMVTGELMYAAEKYDLNLLKEFLDEAAGHVVTRENVMELGELAVQCRMQRAEHEILKFFKENVTSTDVFLNDEDGESKEGNVIDEKL